MPANDLPPLAHFSERGRAELFFATDAGMSQEEFLENSHKVADYREASAVQTALHRADLSADDRPISSLVAARISCALIRSGSMVSGHSRSSVQGSP